MWGVQASKYKYGPIEYIEICCLVVALINIGKPRPMVLSSSFITPKKAAVVIKVHTNTKQQTLHNTSTILVDQ